MRRRFGNHTLTDSASHASALTFFFVALLLPAAPVVSADDAAAATAAPTTEADREIGKKAAVKSEYIRFIPGRRGEGVLSTSIVTLERPNGVRVDLVAAIHIADRSYFSQLQKRFESYDSVLYEMVKDPDVDPGRRPAGGDSLLSLLQRGMKETLELEFQLDAIDYSAANFVHADLDPKTFFRLQRERGENVLTLLLQGMRAELDARKSGAIETVGPGQLLAALASEDSARALKFVFAKQMQHAELILAEFEPDTSPQAADADDPPGPARGAGSVLLTERNKAALRVLEKELESGKRRIAIFYGGGHMPDLHARLVREFGFRRVGIEWVDAWNIRKKPKASRSKGLFGRLLGGRARRDDDAESADVGEETKATDPEQENEEPTGTKPEARELPPSAGASAN